MVNGHPNCVILLVEIVKSAKHNLSINIVPPQVEDLKKLEVKIAPPRITHVDPHKL